MSEIEHVLMYKGKIVHFYEKSIREKVSFYLVYTQKDENEPYILYTETPKFTNEERMTKEEAIKFIKQEFNQWLNGGLHSFLTEMWVSASVDLRKKEPKEVTVKNGTTMVISGNPDVTIKKAIENIVFDCPLYKCTTSVETCKKCNHCKHIYRTETFERVVCIGCSYQEGEG